MKKPSNPRIRIRITDTVQKSAEALKNQGRGDILSDVLGSYTGTAQDNETPEQDADDL